MNGPDRDTEYTGNGDEAVLVAAHALIDTLTGHQMRGIRLRRTHHVSLPTYEVDQLWTAVLKQREVTG